MVKLPSPRPLSIKIIAITYIVGSLASIFSPQSPVVFFGIYTSGWLALCQNLLYGLVGFYVGFGLWRLREIARRVSIGWTLWGLPNMVLALVIPSTRVKLAEEMGSQGVFDPSATILIAIVSYIGMSILLGIQLWFLIKRKQAFVKPATV